MFPIAAVLHLAFLIAPCTDALQWELYRFPTCRQCAIAISDANEQKELWERRIANGLQRHNEAQLRTYLEQIDRCVGEWRLLQKAHFHNMPLRVQGDLEKGLASLNTLRSLIGDDAYARGFLWYPVAEHLRLE